jgi:hypothetical protein
VVINISEEYSVSICKDAVTLYREVLSGKGGLLGSTGTGKKIKAVPVIGRGGL